MSNIPIPTYVKEIVDTWNRHSTEIQIINPSWHDEPVGVSIMLPTVNLTSSDLKSVWSSGGPYKDVDEVSNLIDAFTHHDIPIILVSGTKIRPLLYNDLSDFRRWLTIHFQLRAD